MSIDFDTTLDDSNIDANFFLDDIQWDERRVTPSVVPENYNPYQSTCSVHPHAQKGVDTHFGIREKKANAFTEFCSEMWEKVTDFFGFGEDESVTDDDFYTPQETTTPQLDTPKQTPSDPKKTLREAKNCSLLWRREKKTPS